ncbi:MAG TPA: PAS domain S-box protein [Acidimicrobiia bacterium]|nr:PAS domain S-box protein [Acidimicrobiia bacterium]
MDSQDQHLNALTDAALRQALEAAPDGVLIVDHGGTILYANPTLVDLFGYADDELVGRPVEMLVPEGARPAHTNNRRDYVDHPRTRPMGSGLDLRGRRKDGLEVPVEISLSPVPDSAPPLVVAIVRDVQERREVAEALTRAQEALALVEDRERIARDLHDTVIQRLFAVGLSLQGALLRTTDSDLVDRLERAIDEIDTTIRDIRTAIFALHSRRTAGSGPRDAVLAIVHEASRALGFEPHVHFDGLVDSSMPDAIRAQLLPTLRESLTNVAKHARATRVDVEVVVDREVELRVLDNGVGVPEETTAHSGLGNIADRASLLGGSCTVRRRPEGGTVVEWRVPRTSA